MIGRWLLLLSFALAVGTARALSAKAWLRGGSFASDSARTRDPEPYVTSRPPLIVGGVQQLPVQELSLGLLPFALKEAMLPGESRRVRVADDTLRLLLDHAAAEHSSCCGQMLLGSGGEVASVATLLEVDEQEPDGNDAVLATLRCVGRVTVRDLRTADAGFMLASVSLHTDEDEDVASEEEEVASALTAALAGEDEAARAAADRADEQIAAAEAAARAVAASADAQGVSAAEVVQQAQAMFDNLEGEISKSHANVARLRAQLSNGAVSGKERLPSDGPIADHLPVDEAILSLDDLVASRRRSLLDSAGGINDGLTTLCEGVGEVWDVTSEAAATRTLLSFAAAATMNADVRTHALFTQSATERLCAALCALRETERRLAAVLSLRGVASDMPDSPTAPPGPPPPPQ